MPIFGGQLKRFKGCPILEKNNISKPNVMINTTEAKKEFYQFGVLVLEWKGEEIEKSAAAVNKKKFSERQLVRPRIQYFVPKHGLATVVQEDLGEERITLSKFKSTNPELFKKGFGITTKEFLHQAFVGRKPLKMTYCNDQEDIESGKSGFDLGLKNVNLHTSLDDYILPESQGISIPFFYIGFTKSMAPFHTEDAKLLALNVMISGKAKDWFFIPPRFARQYEKFVEKYYRCECQDGKHCRGVKGHIDRSKNCTNFASHKDVFPDLLSLEEEGIQYYTFKQLPGDAVITGPDVYHGIVNTGLNYNWAVNFDNKNWEENHHFTKLLCSCGHGDTVATNQINSVGVAAMSPKKATKAIPKVMLYALNHSDNQATSHKEYIKLYNSQKKKTWSTKRNPVYEKLFKYHGEEGERTAIECTKCGKLIKGNSLKSNMNIHIRTKHLGGNEFKCPQCQKQFKFKHHVQIHMDSRHNNKKFPCTICDKPYKSNTARIAHENLKHQ